MSSNAARRLLALLTVFAGAFVAAVTLTTSVPRNFAFVAGGDRLDVFLGSAASAAALGSVVAVVTTLAVRRARWALASIALGVALVVASSAGGDLWALHPRAAAAGLILGGAAALSGAGDRRTAQCSLVLGLLVGVTLAAPIVDVPLRYAEYEYVAEPAPQTYYWIIVGVLALLVAAAAWVSPFGAIETAQARMRILLVGIIVPLVGLVLYWLFVRAVDSLGADGTMQNRWLLGLLVVPLLVGAAFTLPRRTGSIVLVALAFIAASSTSSLEASATGVFVVCLLVGFVIGMKWRLPLAALGVLAVVAATGVFAGSQLDAITTVAVSAVLPLAAGVAFASLLPTESSVAVIAATTPVVVTVPIIVEFGWTAYTPLTRIQPSYSPSIWEWASTAVSVMSIVVAGAGLVLLRRRETEKPTQPPSGSVAGD